MSTLTRKIVVGLLVLVLLVVFALLGWAMWGPKPQGTPKLSPEMEALRPDAVGCNMHQPVNMDYWSLVLTHADAEEVSFQFWNSAGSTPHAKVPAGSSSEVLGCKISVRESHPGRPKGSTDTTWALLAVECPDSLPALDYASSGPSASASSTP